MFLRYYTRMIPTDTRLLKTYPYVLKYHRITDGGKEHIQEFLHDWQQVTDIYDFVKGAVENEEG